MKEVILTANIPDSCLWCKKYNAENDICSITEKADADSWSVRPDWCPLRLLPKRKMHEEIIYAEGKEYMKTNAFSEYERGWNDCLDELLGEKNESNTCD